MADITKHVNRGIPASLRTQNFTNADAVQGDVLKVHDSLGFPAKYVSVTASADMRIKFNVYHTVFPRRTEDGLPFSPAYPNLASGMNREDTTTYGNWDIQGPGVTTFDRVVAVRDIKLVTVSGNFDIFVS